MEAMRNILKKIGRISIIVFGVIALLIYYLIIFPIGIIVILFCIDDLIYEKVILQLPLEYIIVFFSAIVAFILGCIINMISLKLGWKIYYKDNHPNKKEIILLVFYIITSLICSALSTVPFTFIKYFLPA